MLAKWLNHREYYSTRRRINGISFHKVKLTIRHRLITRIQTVQIHHFDKQLIFYCSVWYIVHINATRIVLILNVQFKLLLLHLIASKVINILHHQVPQRCLWRCSRTFQQFNNQCLWCIYTISRKFTDLICLTIISIFKCNSQHLIIIQCLTQRNET